MNNENVVVINLFTKTKCICGYIYICMGCLGGWWGWDINEFSAKPFYVLLVFFGL